MKARGAKHEDGMSSGDKLDAIYVRDAIAGDPDAFTELFYRHEKPVRRQVARYFAAQGFSDAHLIETAVDDTFLKAQRSLELFDVTKGTFGTWLYKIAKNACIDLVKQHRKHEGHASLDRMQEAGTDPATPGLSIEEQVISRDQVDIALNQLQLDQREAIRRVIIDEMSYEAAAAYCGKPRGTIGSRVSRGKEHLRAILRRGVEDDNDR